MRRLAITMLAVVAAAGLLAVPAAAAKRHRPPKVSIAVLSGRADLVSGESALVRIGFSRRSAVRRAKVRLGKRNVKRSFHRSGRRRLVGVLTGLRQGRNVLRVSLPHRRGARMTLVDHPASGPVFSGPQLQPWKCQPTAQDAQCNQPADFQYVYKSSDPNKSAGF